MDGTYKDGLLETMEKNTISLQAICLGIEPGDCEGAAVQMSHTKAVQNANLKILSELCDKAGGRHIR